jgi:hypothetical protein
MSLSVGSGDVFTIYDVIGKLLPGGLLFAVLIIVFPSGTEVYQVLSDLNVVGALVLVPVAYVLGGVIESLGGLHIRRKYHFQQRIHSARHELAAIESGLMAPNSDAEPGSSDYLAREAWVDIVERFDFPDSYLRAETCINEGDDGCQLDTDGRQGRWYYRWVMVPLLVMFARVFPHISEEELTYERKELQLEGTAREVVVQYLDDQAIGRIDRFDSLYVLFRSLAFLSSFVFVLSVVILFGGFAVPLYAEILASGRVSSVFLWSRYPIALLVESFVVAVMSLVVYPIVFSKMRHYDQIRDNHTISTYYANVVASGTTAEQ